jgi:carboxypeptidase Q
MKLVIVIFFIATALYSMGQDREKDSIFIKQIYDAILTKGKAHDDLRELCKDVGARLSGSAEAEMAVHWGKSKLKHYGFDKVYLQDIMVPHWERGTKEVGWYKSKNNDKLHKVSLLALGGSVGTDGTMTGDLVMFQTRQDLQAASEAEVKDKIVFINQPMDQKMINTFAAYGGCYPIRGLGGVDAARKGAKAVIIRSLSLSDHDHPHTGTMQYETGLKKIPAAALSTNDANELSRRIESGEKMEFIFEMNCQSYPDKPSHNVIAEITGSENPNSIITFGGHLDSWDVGEGAHDDGAGIVHSMEALRILKELGYRPKNTLRVVFFMNEENGNMGGKTYAKYVKELGENHIAAIESDRGGFTPRGFSVDGSEAHLELVQSFEGLLTHYDLHKFEKGYGGVDINPLKDEFDEIVLLGFIPDSQRYFDFHHNENDIFENVNKRELHLGCAAMAAMVYLLDQYLLNE